MFLEAVQIRHGLNFLKWAVIAPPVLGVLNHRKFRESQQYACNRRARGAGVESLLHVYRLWQFSDSFIDKERDLCWRLKIC